MLMVMNERRNISEYKELIKDFMYTEMQEGKYDSCLKLDHNESYTL